MSTRSRTLAAFVLVLLSVWGIGATAVVTPATADPASAPGWMPEEPPPLTAEQQQWLKPLDGTDEDGKYLVITCHDHREFAGCAPHDPSEQSKDIDAYVFNASDRSYAGVKAMVPEQLAKEHRELLDDNGVLDCEKARNKIPACANPGGAPKPAQFDEQGRFVKLTEGGVGQADTNVDLSALNPANAAKDLLDNWFAQACESVGKFAGDLLVLSMTWWLRTDSIDVTSGGILAGERAVQILVMMVLALGILSAAITMALSRRPGPAAELGVGAFKFLLICSLSGIVVTGALHAADDFARQITANGAEEFGPNLKAMLGIATIRNPGGVLLLGVVAFVLGAVQWLIGFARQAGLVILFAMLIFAAAGQLSSWGRQWFPRIVAMMLALILYKPFAAALYTIGFKLMGNEQSLSSVMVGLMTIGLCVLTLPTMLAFFKWVSPGAQGGASVGTVLAGGGAIAAAGMGQFAGGGAGGDSQSNYMDSTGPGSSGGGEADPSPGNSPGGFGSGGGGGESTDGSSGGEAGGSSPEADLGAGDLGPASEAPDAGGGVPMPGGAGGGADAAGAAGGAEAAGGGAAAANPYVAAAMAAKETVETAVDTVGEVAEGAATEATGGDDTGPDMQ